MHFLQIITERINRLDKIPAVEDKASFSVTFHHHDERLSLVDLLVRQNFAGTRRRRECVVRPLSKRLLETSQSPPAGKIGECGAEVRFLTSAFAFSFAVALAVYPQSSDMVAEQDVQP